MLDLEKEVCIKNKIIDFINIKNYINENARIVECNHAI